MARMLVAALLTAAAAAPLFAQAAAPVAPTVATAPMPSATNAAKAPMTRAEVQTRVATRFARRDTNRDGFLTADELMRKGGKRMMMMHRGQRGPNGGAMAMGDPNLAFDRIDANRDGTISRSEFAAGRQVRIEKRVVMNQPGQPHGMRMMMRRGGGMMGAAMMQRADTNRDGRVSLAEATGAALQHFDMMDANRDGRITPEERAAGRARMMQMHKAG